MKNFFRTNLAALLAISLLVTILAGCAKEASVELAQVQKAGKLKPDSELIQDDWLLGAESDLQRFERLQQNLRGFDQPMWEVGERYQIMYDALKDENFDMARYQWRKIKTTIENGIMKRPGRAKNANEFLLNKAWQVVDDDYISRDIDRAWKGFTLARDTCMSCHTVEVAMGLNASFINDQPLFRNTLPPSEAKPAASETDN